MAIYKSISSWISTFPGGGGWYYSGSRLVSVQLALDYPSGTDLGNNAKPAQLS